MVLRSGFIKRGPQTSNVSGLGQGMRNTAGQKFGRIYDAERPSTRTLPSPSWTLPDALSAPSQTAWERPRRARRVPRGPRGASKRASRVQPKVAQSMFSCVQLFGGPLCAFVPSCGPLGSPLSPLWGSLGSLFGNLWVRSWSLRGLVGGPHGAPPKGLPGALCGPLKLSWWKPWRHSRRAARQAHARARRTPHR